VELQYEPSAKGRPVVVEQDGETTRIIVLMPGLYAPIPSWISSLDVFALIVAPVWWIATLVIRTLLRMPKPPRAVFEVTRDRFKVRICDRVSDETRSFDCPRSSVAEARANRYERGLWLDLTGQVKETILSDLPQDTIDRIEAALQLVLAGGDGGQR
jgi:hypothetical protein